LSGIKANTSRHSASHLNLPFAAFPWIVCLFFFGHLFSELFRQGFGAMAGGGGKKNNQRALATNSHDQKRNS